MVTKTLPTASLKGIQDLSRKQVTITKLPIPSHLPHLMFLAERGPITPQLVNGNGFGTLYGLSTLDPKRRYATHQTAGILTCLMNNNSILAQRLQPPNASTAMIRLSVELVPTTIDVYSRNAAGQIVYTTDPVHGKVPVVLSQINGTRLVWHTSREIYPNDATSFGEADVVQGFRQGNIQSNITGNPMGILNAWQSSPTYSTSTLYPIIDIEVDSFGQYGNDYAIQLKPVLHGIKNRAMLTLQEQIRSCLMNLTILHKEPTGTVNAVRAYTGATESPISLLHNAENPLTSANMSLGSVVTDHYQIDETDNLLGIPGPFGKVHHYTDSLVSVLEKLTQGYLYENQQITGERDYDSLAINHGRVYPFSNNINMNLLNILTANDHVGNSFYTFVIDTSGEFSGINPTTPIYATGGSDGLFINADSDDAIKNLEIFDKLVRHECENYGDTVANMGDVVRYPASTLWDTGFSLATKKAMLLPIAKYKHLNLFLSTFAVADYVEEVVALLPDPALPSPTITFVEDNNADGIIRQDTFTNPMHVRLSVPVGVVIGDVWKVTSNNSYGGLLTGYVTVNDISAGYVRLTYNATPGSIYSLTGNYKHAVTEGQLGNGIVILALNAPIVTNAADVNQNGLINAAEYVNPMPIRFTIPMGAEALDTWYFKLTLFNNVDQQPVLIKDTTGVITVTDINNGYVEVLCDISLANNNGIVRSGAYVTKHGVDGDIGVSSWVIDNTVQAPIIRVVDDVDSDGTITPSEYHPTTTIRVSFPNNVVVGDAYNVNAGIYGDVTGIITQTDIDRGYVEVPVVVPQPITTVTIVPPTV